MAEVFKNPLAQSEAMTKKPTLSKEDAIRGMKEWFMPNYYDKSVKDYTKLSDDEVYSAYLDEVKNYGDEVDEQLGLHLKNQAPKGRQIDVDEWEYDDVDADYERAWGPVNTPEKYKQYQDWLKKGPAPTPNAEFELDAKKYPDVTKTPYGFIYNVNNKSITDLAGGKKKLGYSLSNNDSGFTVADGGEEVFFKDFDSAYKYAKGGK